MMTTLCSSASERIDRLGEKLRIENDGLSPEIQSANERIDGVLLADRNKQRSQMRGMTGRCRRTTLAIGR